MLRLSLEHQPQGWPALEPQQNSDYSRGPCQTSLLDGLSGPRAMQMEPPQPQLLIATIILFVATLRF